MIPSFRALALVTVYASVTGCSTRRWRAPLSSLDGGSSRAVPTAAYGPPRPPNTVPTVQIFPGEDVLCRTDSDCPDHGYCFTPEVEARYSQAFRDCSDAQAWRNAHAIHRCFHHRCTSDADCPRTQRCAESNMLPFPQRECIDTPCRGFMDCRATRLGACVSYLAGRQCEHGGWACAYPTDECFPGDPSRRCVSPPGQIAYCIPVRGRFRCVNQAPPPP